MIAAITPVAVLLVLRSYEAHQVSRLVKEIESDGEPTTLADTLQLYERPNPDATSLWLDAFSKLDTFPEEDLETLSKIPYVGYADEPGPGSWDDIDVSEAYLGERAEIIEILHKAAELGGRARFPVDPKNGFSGFLFPDGLLAAHSLLRLETSFRAYRGDGQQAIKTVRSRLALSNSFENSPDSSSQMAGQAIANLALRDFAKYSYLSFSEQDLLELQLRIRDASYQRGLTLAISGSRAEGISLFQNPEAAKSYIRLYNGMLAMSQIQFVNKSLSLGLEEISPQEIALWSYLRPWDGNLFVRTTSQLVSASQSPWPEAIEQASQIEDSLNKKQESAWPATTYLLTGMLVRSPTKLFTSVGRYTALHRLFDTAIAVELFRRYHGVMPETLSDLTPEFLPEMPIDPFSGQPVRFAMEEDGFVVYSVGENRVDDGGNGTNNGVEPDITCRLRTIRPN